MGEERSPLTAEEPEDISRGIAQNMSNKEITAFIGRDDSVVCREASRNGGREGYRAVADQQRAEVQRKRPKVRKLDHDPRLHDRVFAGLRRGESPDQVVGRLKFELKCGKSIGLVGADYTLCKYCQWMINGFWCTIRV